MGDSLRVTDGAAVTRDGISLAYTARTAPAPGRPRVALIHSLALDRSVWTPVAERLAEQADVVTYDCRGHGRSTRALGPYSIEQFAADLADLLDALQWSTAVVGGVSMGGTVSQAFAAQHPDRVNGLLLADTTAWYGPSAPSQWEERAVQAEVRGLQSLVGFQMSRWFGDRFRAEHPEVVDHFVRIFTGNDVACYAASCRMLGAFDLRSAVAGLAVPTSIVVGDEDYATPPAMARQLHEAIRGSSLHVFEQARHLSPLERPDEIAALARTELLARLAGEGA